VLTLVLGVAKSGKSSYAQALCHELDKAVFVATAAVEDDAEMEARITQHRAARPGHWLTVEAPLEVVAAVEAQAKDSVVLVDCVTVWISNLMFHHRFLDPGEREKQILDAAASLASATRDRQVIAVSNDVGGGIVPETPVAREFRDLQGIVNQMLAREAKRVVLVVAGLPIELKP
jgi:adenosylcobinamide kinase/adenosylcobinamide-phosphate guanylyltransferase